MKQSIALIGPGRVGCAVSKCLHEAGYPITAVIGRNRQRAAEACKFIGCSPDLASAQLTDGATAHIVLLAVPDDQIRTVALRFQAVANISKQTTLIHFSGFHPAEIMRRQGSPVALLSLHPLFPFADRQKAFEQLHQAPCAIEGDNPQILALGEELVNAMGGSFFTIAGNKKKLYHAAACIASNYLVTLLAAARDLLIRCGIEADQTMPLLLPLVQAALDNVKDLGCEQGLTGPIVRGDIGTVTEHIQALQNGAPELLALYLQMGENTTGVVEKSDRLDAESVSAMLHIFSPGHGKRVGLHGVTGSSEKNN